MEEEGVWILITAGALSEAILMSVAEWNTLVLNNLMINMSCHVTLSILDTHSRYDISQIAKPTKPFSQTKKVDLATQGRRRRISKANWMVKKILTLITSSPLYPNLDARAIDQILRALLIEFA